MNTFFFFRRLSISLAEELKDHCVFEIYRQTKQSIIFCFEKKGHPFYVEACFFSEECLLNFPEQQTRSRKAVSLLKETWGLKIISIEQAANERSFVIHLENELSIVFKWFGRQSNILLWHKGEVIWMLRNKLSNDLTYNASTFHKPREWSEDEFKAKEEDLHAFIPQLPKPVIDEWMLHSHWKEINHPKDRWKKVDALLSYLNNPWFYIIKQNKRVHFTLFYYPNDNIELVAKEHNPIQAANIYFYNFYRYNRVEALREKLEHYFGNRISQLTKQTEQLSKGIEAFDASTPPQQLADLIMANLSAFQKNDQAHIFNFYTNETVLIKIKSGMSASDYAGSLYKKSKNRLTEKANMLSRLEQLKLQQIKFTQLLHSLPTEEARGLLNLQETYLPVSAETKKSKEKTVHPVFKTYDYQGYQIYVGRNAKNNDELTLHFAHKEDLWLHAKDVSGSHVIIRNKNNNVFPKTVIEKAAQLAAFYSKRKTDSLCPVMYTTKKYVRKVKGAAPGMVRVEKEKVILVEPLDF
jgi:predicted ribosome quality control (RQC) complex YloA/Tae2 family protein